MRLDVQFIRERLDRNALTGTEPSSVRALSLAMGGSMRFLYDTIHRGEASPRYVGRIAKALKCRTKRLILED